MPLYKRCSRCGRRLLFGDACACLKQRHKDYDRYTRDEKSRQYYHSREWTLARDATLQQDDYIDVYLYMTSGELVIADTVHHIIPLREDWERRNDINNLISLHHATHSHIEALYKQDREKIQNELFEILRQFRKNQGGRGT